MIVLVAVTLGLYWPTVGYDFVAVDDPDFVTENPYVRQGLTPESVKWAFVETHASNWLPFTWLSLMADRGSGALDPAPYHRTNVLLHALNAALVFACAAALSGRWWASLLLAALFALHPLRVESVAWIAERKDVLSSAFWFACTLSYALYARTRRQVWYVASLVLFAGGLLSKAMLVTLPFTLLLLDAWPLRRPLAWKARWREKIPFFALSVAVSVITFMAQRGGGAVSGLEKVDLLARLANAIVAYERYLTMTVWPVDLSYLYLHPAQMEAGGTWSLSFVVGAILAVGVMTTSCVNLARRGMSAPLVGWLWYLGTLVPVIGIVQVGSQSVADRYTYIPQLGLWIFLVAAVVALAERGRVQRAIAITLSVLAVSASAVGTYAQVPVWRDSRALFERAVAQNGRNFQALNGLGTVCAQAGEQAAAMRYLQQAIEVKPSLPAAHTNLGNVFYLQRNLDRAEHHYRQALRYDPTSDDAHVNLLSIALTRGDMASAEQHAHAAIAANPMNWRGHLGLARVQGARGEWKLAREAAEAASRLRPDNDRVKAMLEEARRQSQ